MSNPRVMLTRNEVDEMLDLWDDGWTVDELAEKFDCSRATVSVAIDEALDEEDDEDDQDDPKALDDEDDPDDEDEDGDDEVDEEVE